jgi:hypothetical protein
MKNFSDGIRWGLAVFAVALLACEDKISPTLETAAPVLVVDAWINNKPEVQAIILNQSQPYFEAVLPTGVSGAVVNVTDDKGKVYAFNEDDKTPGNYLWKPQPNEVFGSVGRKYKLTVVVNGETFESSSYMGRVPLIDSITFDTEKRTSADEWVTRGQFWATDPPGPGDTYFIRTYKNGILLAKPSEINVAYDAGFSAGGDTDGVTFITPIRRGINSNDQDANGKALSPIISGDSLNVQVHSITLAAFNYLNEVAVQTDRPGGFQELFARPLANVSTNISNTNPRGSTVVGFFNVAAVSMAGKRYRE